MKPSAGRPASRAARPPLSAYVVPRGPAVTALLTGSVTVSVTVTVADFQ
ncbi:hypothetical protein [Streptomyces mirabilis]|nr:hypothetical protein [Streptomyces mirabilis]